MIWLWLGLLAVGVVVSGCAMNSVMREATEEDPPAKRAKRHGRRGGYWK